MLQTPIMNHPRGINGRRYSHLDVSGGGSLLRPRSCSTSMVTVTEASPDLRCVGGNRRPPPTPCATPCFVSPRMAFTTQFSYDSPIQVITCCGGDLLHPVAKWTSRLHLRSVLCSKKGLVFLAFLSLCMVSFLLLSGKDAPPAEGLCDAQDPALCDHHEVRSPLQKFLRQENSAWYHSATEPQQDEAPAAAEEEQNLKEVEPRYNRPKMLTIQGQYEDSDEEMSDYQDTSGELIITDDEERGEETEDNQELQQFLRDDLLRARRAIGDKDGPFAAADLSTEDPHSMRILTEEALPPPPPGHPRGVDHEGVLETHTREYEREHRGSDTVDPLYVQHGNLEPRDYHREQQSLHRERAAQEMLRPRQQEDVWQEQSRQAHHRTREGRQHPHPRRGGSGEQWEAGHHPSMGRPHQAESGWVEGRHPSRSEHQHRGQRLPRGVNPRRYYLHEDL